MSKPISSEDFRAFRMLLERGDFALSSGKDIPPTDLVEENIWRGLTLLTDDVSIRTSNEHGSFLKKLYNVWGGWIEVAGDKQDYLFPTILVAGDEFQGSIFNALHGFYRHAFSSLRNALEQITVGTYFQINKKKIDYKKWLAGELEVRFGSACENLSEAKVVQPLSKYLKTTLNDSVFNKKSKINSGGWARRLYSELSNYSHTRPGFANADKWESNGPIYVKNTFIDFTCTYMETSALCLILVKLGRPDFILPKDIITVFEFSKIRSLKISNSAFQFLFNNVNGD